MSSTTSIWLLFKNTHICKPKCYNENLKFTYFQKYINATQIKENEDKFSVSAFYGISVKLQTSMSTILEKI